MSLQMLMISSLTEYLDNKSLNSSMGLWMMSSTVQGIFISDTSFSSLDNPPVEPSSLSPSEEYLWFYNIQAPDSYSWVFGQHLNTSCWWFSSSVEEFIKRRRLVKNTIMQCSRCWCWRCCRWCWQRYWWWVSSGELKKRVERRTDWRCLWFKRSPSTLSGFMQLLESKFYILYILKYSVYLLYSGK